MLAAVLVAGAATCQAQANEAPTPQSSAQPVDWLQVLKDGGSERVIRTLQAQLKEWPEYELWMTRQERLPSGWNDEAFVHHIKYRHAPRQVYMTWLPGGPKAGQEILFDETQRTDVMYGHLSGLFNVASMWTALDGHLAKSNSRHPIRDVGIQSVAHILAEQLDAHKQAKGWPAPTQVETQRSGQAPVVSLTWLAPAVKTHANLYAHKTRISLIPTRPWIKSVESWDSQGQPLERIVFERMEAARFTDLDFSSRNPQYRF